MDTIQGKVETDLLKPLFEARVLATWHNRSQSG